jgi:hypothetical protein
MLEDEQEHAFLIALGSIRSIIIRSDKPYIGHKRGYTLIYEPGLINLQRVLISGLDFQEFRDNCFKALPNHKPALSKAFRAFLSQSQKDYPKQRTS